jgi:hypothetical protein
MSNGLLYEANEVLRDLKRIRAEMLKKQAGLAKYEGYILRPSTRKTSSRTYYRCKRKGPDKKSKYLGNDDNRHVRSIKSLRYADKALEVLSSNIQLLEDLISNYVSPEYNTINSMLHKTYRSSLSSAALDISSSTIPAEAIRWKKQKEAEKRKHPPYKPEQLTRRALDGTLMRSKSEVIIANILILSGIPFVYELPMKIKGKSILPDFTILSLIDLRTEIIIEHQGMIFAEEYEAKYIRSLKLYLQSDLVINRDLFFTFDTAEDTPDTREVESILVKFIKPSYTRPQMMN